MNDATGPRRSVEPDEGWVEVDLPFPGVRQFEEEFAPNLATDGLFIPTPEPLPPSTVVRFHVTLPDDFVLLEGTGVVVWARPPGDPSGAPPGMSLRFATLSQHYQDLLDRIVQTHVERGGTPFEVEPRLGDATGETGAESVPSPAARGVASERPRLTVRRAGLPTTPVGDEDSDPSITVAFDSNGPLDRTISLEPRHGPAPDQAEGSDGAFTGEVDPPADPDVPQPEPSPDLRSRTSEPDSVGHWPPWEPSVGSDIPTATTDPASGETEPAGGRAHEAELEVPVPETVYPDEVSREIPEELFSDDLDVELPQPEPGPPPELLPHDDLGVPSTGTVPVTATEGPPPRARRWSMGRTIGTVAAAVVVIGIVAVLVLSPWSRIVGGEAAENGETADADTVAGVGNGVAPASAVIPADAPEVSDPDIEGPAEAPEDQVPVADPKPTGFPEPIATMTPASSIDDIRWSDDGVSTTIRLRGNGVLLPERVALIPMTGPPRLLIRIRYIESRYRSYVMEVASPHVTAIRTGLHPELSPPALYVVADLTSDDVVVSGPRFDGPELTVTVGR